MTVQGTSTEVLTTATVAETYKSERIERLPVGRALNDAVLLAPACASFDWYPTGGYPARGDDFRTRVREHLERVGTT